MNGADLYKLTVQDWVDMNKSIADLNSTTKQLNENTDKLGNTLTDVGKTLGEIQLDLAERQCGNHEIRLSGLQRLVKYLWLFLSALVLAGVGALIANALG